MHTFYIKTENWLQRKLNLGMELFSSRRWRLDRAKQKAVVFMLNPKIYATHAWHNFIVVWLLGQFSCSTPFTKELHDQTVFNWQDYISSISSKMANASQKYSSPQQHFFRQAIPLIKTKTQFFSRETNVVHSLYLERRF